MVFVCIMLLKFLSVFWDVVVSGWLEVVFCRKGSRCMVVVENWLVCMVLNEVML